MSATTSTNRIDRLFKEKSGAVLNVYFTAGFPQLDSTVANIEALAAAGVDLIEVGMPFSDPLADGPTIQGSNERALENGMHLKLLLEQVAEARRRVDTPIVLMGYFNQVMQYGEEAFVKRAAEIGVDGLILPDLPLDVYEEEYREIFERHGLGVTFLISPQTSAERIRKIDALSHGFIYMVSSSSITGGQSGLQGAVPYFERVQSMGLETPRLIGFGISKAADFQLVSRYADGAVVGSALIRALERGANVMEWVNAMRGE